MSLPVEKIYCDRCDFWSNTMATWGNYSYRLADGSGKPSGPGTIEAEIGEMERQLRAAAPTGLLR